MHDNMVYDFQDKDAVRRRVEEAKARAQAKVQEAQIKREKLLIQAKVCCYLLFWQIVAPTFKEHTGHAQNDIYADVRLVILLSDAMVSTIAT